MGTRGTADMSARSEVQDFQRDVIERSRELPVVGDFWAEWCGPCRALSPVLEKLATEQEDRWALAKVNTEVFQEEAMRYGVSSIPNVKMFSGGAVIGEFVGALPEYAVRQWLAGVLPGKFADTLQEAKDLLASGDEAGARDLLESIVAEDGADKEARVLLAASMLFENSRRSEELVHDIDDPKLSDQVEMIRTISHLFSVLDQSEPRSDSPTAAVYRNAISALRQKDFEGALDAFISVIRSDRYYDDDGARKACIAIFRWLGDEHPATTRYRREFSMALY